MTNKLIVAFRTIPTPGLVPDISSIEAPSNYKDPIKIAQYVEEQKQKLLATAADQPYLGTFAEVRIADIRMGVDAANNQTGKWLYREAGSGRQAACLAIRAWLLKAYPTAWPHTTHPSRPHSYTPQVIFVGFDPGRFLRMLGIECSLPVNNPGGEPVNVLPLSAWYSGAEYRDLEAAAMSGGSKLLSWPVVLKARGLAGKFPGWTGPGVDVEKDLAIAICLAHQLGMLNEEDVK